MTDLKVDMKNENLKNESHYFKVGDWVITTYDSIPIKKLSKEYIEDISATRNIDVQKFLYLNYIKISPLLQDILNLCEKK